MASMANLNSYDLKPINYNMRPFSDDSFLDTCVNACYEYKPIQNATKIVRTIINAKHEKADLHKTVTKKCQHLTVIKLAKLLTLINKYQSVFYVILGTWDMDPVDFELIEGAKPVCSRPYPVLKAH